MKRNLARLRNLLTALATEMAGESAASSAEIVDRFLIENKSDVKASEPLLVRLALIKLVNDVCRRKPPATVTNIQGELFQDYSGPGVLSMPPNGSIGRSKKTILDMTKSDLKSWLQSHRQKEKAANKQYQEVLKLFASIETIGTEQITVRDALKLAGEKSKKA